MATAPVSQSSDRAWKVTRLWVGLPRMGSTVAPVQRTASRASSTGSESTADTWWGWGTAPMDWRTKSAGSPPGIRRAWNRTPARRASARRSTRKVRQPSRRTSQATRYQRVPALTRWCGSTRRLASSPSRRV